MVGREVIFEYSIYPTFPYEIANTHPPWHVCGHVVEKRFWKTPEGTQGYYKIHRTIENDIITLPLGVLRAIWSV